VVNQNPAQAMRRARELHGAERMNTFKEAFSLAFNYISNIGISDVLDILIVAFLVYKLTELVRKTSTSRVARGLIVLLLFTWLSGELSLNVIHFILLRTVEMGLLALVILFQPELRRILEKVGTSRIPFFGRESHLLITDNAITQIVLACADLSRTKTGALIIFERDNRLDDQIRTGTVIDAAATAELLKNIFYPKAPLHDGAVIIRDGRIKAAGCVLPLSHNANLSRDLGMRHRAGIGMSEYSDAVVVIVSEETGSISVAVDGMLKRHLATDTFEKLLRNELLSETEKDEKKSGFLAGLFKGNKS
jgi:diadenylate cyclase